MWSDGLGKGGREGMRGEKRARGKRKVVDENKFSQAISCRLIKGKKARSWGELRKERRKKGWHRFKVSVYILSRTKEKKRKGTALKNKKKRSRQGNSWTVRGGGIIHPRETQFRSHMDKTRKKEARPPLQGGRGKKWVRKGKRSD